MAIWISGTGILLIMGDAGLAADMEGRLQKLGYPVCAKTNSVQTGLELIETHKPGLVVLDVILSNGMDGKEAARIIWEKWGLPIIFLVGETDVNRLELAQPTFPFGYLLKPYQDQDIRTAVRMALISAGANRNRQQAECNLKHSDEKFKSIAEQSADLIFLTDLQGYITYISGVSLEIFGYPPDEMVNRHITEFLAEDSMGLALTAFAAAVEQGIPARNLNMRMKRGDGSTFIGELTGRVFEEHGTPAGTIGVCRDITEQKKAEEALRQSEGRYRLLAENSFDVIFMTDENLVISFVSPSMERLLGYTPEEMFALKLEDYIDPETLGPVIEQIQKRLESEKRGIGDNESRSWILKYIRKDGGRIWGELITTPIRNERGKFKGLVGVIREVTDRVEAETALRESEERYRRLFETSGILVSVYDVKGNCLMMNEKTAEWFGGLPEHFVGKNFKELHEAAGGEYEDRILKVIESGEIMTYEDLVEFPNDNRWLLSSLHPVRDSQGRTYAAQIMSQDITDRKQAEEDLRESENKMRSIFRAAPIGIGLTANRVFMELNDRFYEMTGYSSDELIGKNTRIIYPTDEEYEYVDREKYRQITEKQTDTVETRIQRRDGRIINVVMSSTPLDPSDLSTGVTFTALDITERKRADEALRESEERYRLLFEKSPLGIMHFNPEGVIVDCNDNFANIVGVSRQEMIGFDMLSALLEGPARESVRDTLEFGSGKFEGQYRTVAGDKNVHIKAIHQRITDRNGAVIGGISVVEDVSEKVHLESKLRQAQKMEAVGTLAGGVAHDFNNLLQAINGFTEILILEKTEKAPEYQGLKAIQNAGQRAAELVKQLLLFSRKVETERQPVNLNREIEQAQKMLAHTIPKMVEIETRLSNNIWTINADPVQIEQILLNLGTNAADAMPEGGTLSINTENVSLDEEYAPNHLAAEPGKYVLLKFSDTGQGMDQETLEHIFEPFYTTKEVGHGTGLGLASVYGIVKGHGGYITCDSEVGKGTTFNLYLPAMGIKEFTIEKEPVVPQPAPGGNETVLVVDDEEWIRDFASLALKQFGYNSLTAASGEEALDIYRSRQEEIDLVILDIGMPGMGGYKCLQELLLINPTLNILIASGYSIDGQVKKIIENGAAGFMGKPYRLNELLAKVRFTLDKKR